MTQDLVLRVEQVPAEGGSFGDVLVWPDGATLLPYADVRVADPTGGGDAFVAGLVAALATGCPPAGAGRAATAAAARFVAEVGGRPRRRGDDAGSGPRSLTFRTLRRTR